MKSFFKDPIPIVFCTALLAEFVRGLQAYAPNEFNTLRTVVHAVIAQVS
jgi:hypothetical protein